MSKLKIALVHDYIKEYGGAEQVFKTLSEMYPEAPIYTAFKVDGSTAAKEFSGKKIIESWLAPLLKTWRLYSPLRFLTPIIWWSFDFSKYDLVITSCSWYITRGFRVGPKTKIIAYCHTPPRWLYGFETSVGFTKYLPVKIYAWVVGYFMRKYDFATAQQVDYFVANSKNVQGRIKKFYKRDSTLIYPAVEVSAIEKASKNLEKENYFVMVSRLVGAKGLEEAARISKELGIELRIVGEAHGFADVERQLKKLSGGNIRLLGRISNSELYKVLGKAKALIALAKDEDFGMTVVEAQAAGIPVIAFNGGGFKETVIDGVTGVMINEINKKALKNALNKIYKTNWDKNKLRKNAERFSKERFEREMLQFINSHAGTS